MKERKYLLVVHFNLFPAIRFEVGSSRNDLKVREVLKKEMYNSFVNNHVINCFS